MPQQIRLRITPPQAAFLQAIEPYVDFEGAVRTGKTTMLCRKVLEYASTYPGMALALTRWTQDTLDAQLKPAWRALLSEVSPSVTVRWVPDGGYDVFPNGSRVYLRALKASEDTMKFGKLAGLTLAVLGIDQAEQVDEDVYLAYVPARLSQPGYPHQVLLTPNPPPPDHWIARLFPDDERNRDDGFRYIRASLLDMESVVGKDYIEEQYRRYPAGSAERVTLIEGRRGLSLGGDPVYSTYFHRHVLDDDGVLHRWHVRPTVTYDPSAPLYEAWDFAYHPAVLWAQHIDDGWRVLHEATAQDQSVNDFLHVAMAERAHRFPNITNVETVCDPSGWTRNPQGVNINPVGLLQEAGVWPVSFEQTKNFNDPTLEYNAIQQTYALMRRTRADGQPAFLVSESCPMFIGGLAGGYIWSDRSYRGSRTHIRVIEKHRERVYHHVQDCWLYLLMRWGGAQLSEQDRVRRTTRAAATALRLAQRDDGEPFRWGLKPSHRHVSY